MNLVIADIAVRVEGLSGPLAETIASRYAAFQTAEQSPRQLIVDAVVDPFLRAVAPDSSDAPMIFIEQVGTGCFAASRMDNPFRAHVDIARRKVGLRFTPNVYCFDSFLRVLVSLLLARSGGVLLHAASFKIGQHAVIAVGQSGAGKTTLARQGFARVLSDELVAVTPNSRRCSFVAHSTPFWGEFVAGNVRDCAEVKAVYLLRKGSVDSVVPASLTAAAMELLGCTFFFGPSESAGAVLDVCVDLAKTRLAGELHFTPSPGVVTYLEGRTCGEVA